MITMTIMMRMIMTKRSCRMVGGTAPPRGGQCHANDHNYEDDTDEKVKKMMMPIQKLVAGGTAPPRGGHANGL